MEDAFGRLPKEKRRRILNAALEVFAHSDYKRASAEAIAMKAGISKGLLFYYFKNKQALYEACYALSLIHICMQRLERPAFSFIISSQASLPHHIVLI